MAYIALEKILPQSKDASLYKTVLIAATRANELAQGAQPLVKTESKKAATVALLEMAAQKVKYVEVKPKSKKTL
ncbi:MAG: DNA-directed RNA polymerase subunit omega [Candidatus Omnitrophica bacterium ADurb.Bin292]|jgi:DNA-directed RNA polymerase subunit K/omega|nr:MAG: DNA-directed RNA polymerase subunit omega [Candidatus Omnitrophica bacterium ADurb.Bin292]HOG23866.1 DNA-directed RNA polymerase subunit omega [Candidatus Omnitrophota bacterium]HPW77527.1 DNA-directed RNA polymerase subunit omega [Candidatus Omnitrophota bacterium]HQB12555.1 DNA-directed RNA polymerase subunit omega [Candidatus Omnitrophota bacterium]